MKVEIVDAAADRTMRDAFLRLPHDVYAHDPHRVPRLASADRAALAHPRYAEGQHGLLALVDGRPTARVLARRVAIPSVSATAPVGCLGLFECVTPPDGAEALLRAAVARLTAEGVDQVLGPLEGDTWHRYRLNVGPFGDPPFPMEPWNPPYYEAVWRAAGFVDAVRYVSVRISDLAAMLDRLLPRLEAARAAGYRFRRFDPARPEQEFDHLYALSLAGFRDNPVYSDIPHDEFDALYRPVLPSVRPELVQLALGPDGEAAGFVFGFVDVEAGVPTYSLKSIAVLPPHRQRGVAGALTALALQGAQELGARQVNFCLLHEGNPSRRLAGGQGRVFRRYVLFRHAGGQA